MDFLKSAVPAVSSESGFMARFATWKLDWTARLSQIPVVCPSLSGWPKTYPSLGFLDRSVEKAGTPYSPCRRWTCRNLWSFAVTGIHTPSSNRGRDASSLNSSWVSQALVPFGGRPMTEHLTRYRQLERRLWMTRWRHEGRESAEEDTILDEMEMVWNDLPDEERRVLREEGPRCWPTESSSIPPQLADASYVSSPTPWTYEGFHSPAEAILSADAA